MVSFKLCSMLKNEKKNAHLKVIFHWKNMEMEKKFEKEKSLMVIFNKFHKQAYFFFGKWRNFVKKIRKSFSWATAQGYFSRISHNWKETISFGELISWKRKLLIHRYCVSEDCKKHSIERTRFMRDSVKICWKLIRMYEEFKINFVYK